MQLDIHYPLSIRMRNPSMLILATDNGATDNGASCMLLARIQRIDQLYAVVRVFSHFATSLRGQEITAHQIPYFFRMADFEAAVSGISFLFRMLVYSCLWYQLGLWPR